MTIRRRISDASGRRRRRRAACRRARSADNSSVYDLERFGNARILHMTDTHAQPVRSSSASRASTRIGAMRGTRRIWSERPFSIASASFRQRRRLCLHFSISKLAAADSAASAVSRI
jgi:hypothetical protein